MVECFAYRLEALRIEVSLHLPVTSVLPPLPCAKPLSVNPVVLHRKVVGYDAPDLG